MRTTRLANIRGGCTSKRLGVACFVAVAAVGGARLGFRSMDRHEGEAARAAVRVPARARVTNVRCRFEEGNRLGFKMTFDSVVRSFTATAGATASEHPASVSKNGFTSEMYFRVLETEARRAGHEDESVWKLAGMFVRPILRGSDGSWAADKRSIEDPILFEIDAMCRIGRVGSPNDAKSGKLWYSTLKTLEIALPADGLSRTRTWTARQSDANGAYDAAYARTDDQNGRVVIRRRRLAYASVSSSADVRGVLPKVLSSDAAVEFAATGAWFDRFEQQEHVQLVFGEKPLSDIVTTVAIESMPVRADAGDFWTRNFRSDETHWWTAPPDEDEGTLHLQLPYADREPISGLGERALASVKGDFAALLAKQPADYDSALVLLVQYLRLHPDSARALIGDMRTRKMDPFVRAVAFLAIQQTGGQTMHRVLMAAMNDPRLEAINRLQAASALSDVPDPDRHVVNALMDAKRAQKKDAPEDLRNVATLGLGALAGKKQLDTAERARIVAELKHDLRPEADRTNTRAALLALGNSKDQTQVDAVRGFTLHENELVRANAYRALSSLRALPAQGALAETYAHTNNGILKGVLAQAIHDNPEPVTEAELEGFARMLKESANDADLRSVLIALMGPFAGSSARMKSALVAQYRIETVPEIQTLLGRFLPTRDLL